MILVQRHQIKPSSSMYRELDHLCFLSKNLYNATMFEVRQHYFQTGKYFNFLIIKNERILFLFFKIVLRSLNVSI